MHVEVVCTFHVGLLASTCQCDHEASHVGWLCCKNEAFLENPLSGQYYQFIEALCIADKTGQSGQKIFY